MQISYLCCALHPEALYLSSICSSNASSKALRFLLSPTSTLRAIDFPANFPYPESLDPQSSFWAMEIFLLGTSTRPNLESPWQGDGQGKVCPVPLDPSQGFWRQMSVGISISGHITSLTPNTSASPRFGMTSGMIPLASHSHVTWCQVKDRQPFSNAQRPIHQVPDPLVHQPPCPPTGPNIQSHT